jgi:hypothetical protein
VDKTTDTPKPKVRALAARYESRKRHPRITDAELGVVADTMGESLAVVADMLGRSRKSVNNMRAMVRRGDPRKGKRYWTEDEIERMRDLPERVSQSELLELFPGRSLSSIKAKRSEVSTTPYQIQRGGRTLVARTCTACGLLRPAEWFGKTSRGAPSARCRECGVVLNRERPDKNEWRVRMQDASMQHASRGGEDLTDRDHRVLSDPELSDFAKAIKLNRTYVAVTTARRKFGYTSARPNLAELNVGEWLVLRGDTDES